MASGRKAPHGVVLRIAATTICDSDLHVYRGSFPVPKGMVTGHEMTGEVIEAGPDVEFLAEGDLVSVPFNVACGRCRSCRARWRLVPSPARPCTSPARARSAAAARRRPACWARPAASSATTTRTAPLTDQTKVILGEPMVESEAHGIGAKRRR
ncbi:alcohol dehydrogenase catalytic domain-containing protein [Amycolatopsis sp. NPDC004079]|uniref:alcohol dehydrogenase catalytic domain-containing protein n=1 Tax=Amycolatopsis sp. NPDC004079 TaxID=3154549 RepID=UPI0033A38773